MLILGDAKDTLRHQQNKMFGLNLLNESIIR